MYWKKIPFNFLDINECKVMPQACKFGRCVNTMGSYRCICDNGYKTGPGGTTCVDVDECGLDPRPCEFTCHNIQVGDLDLWYDLDL